MCISSLFPYLFVNFIQFFVPQQWKFLFKEKSRPCCLFICLSRILVWSPLKGFKGMKDLINLHSTFRIDFASQPFQCVYFKKCPKFKIWRWRKTIKKANWMWSIKQLMLDIFWLVPNSWGAFTSPRSQLNCHSVPATNDQAGSAENAFLNRLINWQGWYRRRHKKAKKRNYCFVF